MQIHEHLGNASLIGWRKTVADVVAPRVPIADDQARVIVGLGFLALSVYYVVATITRAVRRS